MTPAKLSIRFRTHPHIMLVDFNVMGVLFVEEVGKEAHGTSAMANLVFGLHVHLGKGETIETIGLKDGVVAKTLIALTMGGNGARAYSMENMFGTVGINIGYDSHKTCLAVSGVLQSTEEFVHIALRVALGTCVACGVNTWGSS